jgi:hypothetical protein
MSGGVEGKPPLSLSAWLGSRPKMVIELLSCWAVIKRQPP